MANKSSLPVISIKVNGVKANALIDTGCSTSLFKASMAGKLGGEGRVTAFDGSDVLTSGSCCVGIEVEGRSLTVVGVAVEQLIKGIDVVLGMDVIGQLGGLIIRSGNVQFVDKKCAAAVDVQDKDNICEIKDKDFVAKFDGTDWTVEFMLKNEMLPSLTNKIPCYDRGLDEETKIEFEKEVCRWIDEGILIPWKGEVGGLLPLMAVVQPTKNKVRPVLDYRELNKYVESHTGDDVTDICSEKIREWRQTEGDNVLVDLKTAYLQIKVVEKLWKYQLVEFKGKTYCLTRLGFGLSSAPRIMSKILKTVLASSSDIEGATSSYIDDILVNTSKVSAEHLVKHLSKYGLKTKPPEKLAGGSALGLKLIEDEDEKLVFRRGNEIPTPSDDVSKKELFSIDYMWETCWALPHSRMAESCLQLYQEDVRRRVLDESYWL